MNRIFALAAVLAAFALSADATAQVAAAPQWEAGKNYFVIDPPQPTQTPGKIEVTEVFSYGCPACNFAHTYIDSLRKHLPPNAEMNFVPAAFNPSEDWVVFQRAYYTAKALGIADKAHDAMFDAVWKTRELGIYDASNRIKSPLPTLEDMAKFYAGYGVKADRIRRHCQLVHDQHTHETGRRLHQGLRRGPDPDHHRQRQIPPDYGFGRRQLGQGRAAEYCTW